MSQVIRLKIYLILVIKLFFSSFAEGSTPLFEQLTRENGLSHADVLSIKQDSQGFMWFGTMDGLNRFDGYEFKTFRHQSNKPQSISSNIITAIFEDSQEVLWIGTQNGLNRFNREQETFERFGYYPNKTTGLSDERVYHIIEDKSQNLWVGTNSGGVNRIDPDRIHITHFRFDTEKPYSLNHDSITGLTLDQQGQVWVATPQGLNHYNINTGSFEEVDYKISNSVSPDSSFIGQLFQRDNGNIWMVKKNEVLEFEPESKQAISRFHSTQLEELIGARIQTVFEDKQRTLWIGSDKGIIRFDLNNDNTAHYSSEDNLSNSLKGNNIKSIYEDQSGVLWIGSRGHGINRLVPSARDIKHYQQSHLEPDSLTHDNVTSILVDKHDSVWIGTVDGLNRYYKQLKKRVIYKNERGRNESLIDNYVQVLFEASDGTIWVGTRKGLSYYSQDIDGFVHFTHNKEDPGSISDNSIMAIAEDQYGDLWIGTFYGGLNHFDKNSKVFTHYRHDPADSNSISSDLITTILEDNQGNIWAGSWNGGVSLFKRKQRLFYRYRHSYSDNESISSDMVNKIIQDSQNNIWIGTENGLDKFIVENGAFIYYSPSESQQNQSVRSIVEDKDSNLWLSTNVGLSKFNLQNKSIESYTQHDGFYNIGFNYASYRDHQGKLYFGGYRGVSSFQPEALIENQNKPQVLITEFLLSNKKVELLDSNDSLDNAVFNLERTIATTQTITLSYQESTFTFGFTALDYVNPIENQYKYQLEGWDQDWIDTDYKNRRATYTNIPGGSYTFRVKASNNDGVWNEQGASIKLVILAPPWRTWWAYLLYVIVISGLLATFGLLRYRRLIAEKEKTAALAIISAKDKLFSNVSHEFRTPLTLMLGPLEDFIKKEQSEPALRQLNLIKRNGLRLLSMVDQLLDLARLRGENKQERQSQNVNSIVSLIAQSFQSLADEKNIKLVVNSQLSEVVWVSMLPDALEKIITNLLFNAFKYTPGDGSVELLIDTNEMSLLVAVSDTGCGISELEQSHIFERFTRLETSLQATPGVGIGLALVKELVESHEGKVSVESQLGKGSKFTIQIPLALKKQSANDAKSTIVEAKNHYLNNAIVNLLEEKLSLEEGAVNNTGNTELLDGNIKQKNHKASILIIEDNLELSQYMSGFLSETYHCLVANDGSSGVELAIENVPDLIISDVMMPVMDGFEVCHKLNQDERTSHIPIVLLTARGDKESRIQGWQGCADEYLTKPFDREELLVRIESLLVIREKLQRYYKQITFPSSEKDLKEILSEPKAPKQKEVNFINKFDNVLANNYTNVELKKDLLLEQIMMSERQLLRKLKAITGMTINEYLRAYRLKKAAELLAEGKSVSNVAHDVGFTSHSYFSKCFKEIYGCSPSQYKP